MTTIGICTNASFPESRLSPALARELGVRWARTIVYWREDRSSWHAVIDNARELAVVGTKSLVVFNTEASGTDVRDVALHVARLGEFLTMARGAVAAIEPGNELDTPDWHIPDSLIIQIGRATGPACKAYGVTALSPSLLSGPGEGRFERIAAGLAGYVDAMAVHPYYCSVGGAPRPGWIFGTVEQRADECQRFGSGLPTWFTELGCPTGYDGVGESGQVAFTAALQRFQHPSIPLAFQFCLTDRMVPGHEIAEGKDWGLIRASGKRKPAFAAFAPPVPPPPEFVLGFLAWSQLEPELLGQPLENERGFAEGFSAQRTSTGLAFWVDQRARHSGRYPVPTDVGETFGFVRASDGQRYRWRPGMQRSEVAP